MMTRIAAPTFVFLALFSCLAGCATGTPFRAQGTTALEHETALVRGVDTMKTPWGGKGQYQILISGVDNESTRSFWSFLSRDSLPDSAVVTPGRHVLFFDYTDGHRTAMASLPVDVAAGKIYRITAAEKNFGVTFKLEEEIAPQ